MEGAQLWPQLKALLNPAEVEEARRIIGPSLLESIADAEYECKALEEILDLFREQVDEDMAKRNAKPALPPPPSSSPPDSRSAAEQHAAIGGHREVVLLLRALHEAFLVFSVYSDTPTSPLSARLRRHVCVSFEMKNRKNFPENCSLSKDRLILRITLIGTVQSVQSVH